MNNLIEHINNKDFESANVVLHEQFRNILEAKLSEMKKMCGAAMEQNTHDERQKRLKMDVIEEDEIEEGSLLKFGKKILTKLKSPAARANASRRSTMTSISNKPIGQKLKIVPKRLEEDSEELDEQRIAIVKARIRGGKVQRRQRVSNVPGMTLRGGTLTRMSPAERRRRKLGAIKAAKKSKLKKAQTLRKRKMSLMKRQRLGI